MFDVFSSSLLESGRRFVLLWLLAVASRGVLAHPGLDVPKLEVATVRLRQLSCRPVPLVSLSRAQIESQVSDWLAQKTSAGEEARWAALLQLCGLMPAGRRPLEVRQELLREQVRGFYDARRGHFAVVQDGSGEVLAEATAFHELIHAVQDQHFELLPLLLGFPGEFDRSLAAQCLVEGDANSATVDYMLESAGLPLVRETTPPQFLRLQEPAFFRHCLVMPYTFGQFWVDRLRARGGWQAVDRAYAAPPVSSEQIFHPEKYPDELPHQLELKVAPAAGEVSLGQDTAGEFTFRCWAQQRGASQQVACGWGGDRFEVFQGSAGARVVWHTSWDTAEDAREFQHFLAGIPEVHALKYSENVVEFELWQY